MEEFYKALDEVVSCIVNSKEYQNCLRIKEQMNQNQELKKLISQIKVLQKKYIRNYHDQKIQKELEEKQEQLQKYPIYVVYLQNLEIVNEKIEYVKDCLNDYFYHLFNQ